MAGLVYLDLFDRGKTVDGIIEQELILIPSLENINWKSAFYTLCPWNCTMLCPYYRGPEAICCYCPEGQTDKSLKPAAHDYPCDIWRGSTKTAPSFLFLNAQLFFLSLLQGLREIYTGFIVQGFQVFRDPYIDSHSS